MSHYVGKHTHRFASNPKEASAAKLWNEFNRRPNGGADTLDYLMGDGAEPSYAVTDRDRMVAATLMQWLGSPVGQGYLEQLRERWKEAK